MPNKTYALEWISFANKNLDTARLLIREEHYTDSIAIEIQQGIEKALKSVFAYENKPIPRTHNLMTLYNFAKQHIDIIDIETDDLITISDFYETERYPGPKFSLPEREEVENLFTVAEQLLKKITAAYG